MSLKFLNRLKNIDWLLLVAVFLLILLSLSTLYSLGLSQKDLSSETGQYFNLLYKQIAFSVLGFLLLFVFIFFDYRWLRSLSLWFYLISTLLLILVLFFGQNIHGTTGWFVVNKFSVQPVEIAKLAVIIFLSHLFSRWSLQKYQISLWLKSFLIILPVCILIIVQPDFGSMSVIFLIWLGILWLSGIKKKHLLVFVLVILLFSILNWKFILRDYQKDRFLSFLNPSLDPLGSSYNIRQSVIAIGSGGLLGRGLSLGTQSQLHFLPVSEADFIFSVIAEELGFLGISLLFILYFIILYCLFKIMKNVKDDFGLFLVFGLTLMFLIQIVINIGMALGLLPVTGLPLPFISYGGSFLIISLIAIGIIQNVKLQHKNHE